MFKEKNIRGSYNQKDELNKKEESETIVDLLEKERK